VPAPVPVQAPLAPEPPAPVPVVVPLSGRAAKRARLDAESRIATIVSVNDTRPLWFQLCDSAGQVLWEGERPSVRLVVKRDQLSEVDPNRVAVHVPDRVAIVHATHATVHARTIDKLCQNGGSVIFATPAILPPPY